MFSKKRLASVFLPNQDRLKSDGEATPDIDYLPAPSLDFGTIQKEYSPIRIMIFTMAGIFLAEVIAMLFVYFYRSWPYYLQTLMDATIMVWIIFPLLYFYTYKPLLQHIQETNRFDSILKTRMRLIQSTETSTEAELYQAALDEIETLTGSSIGFFHLIQADQITLDLQAWSTNTLNNTCTVGPENLHFDLEKAGLWADCARKRQPVIQNNYSSQLDPLPLPAGHAVIKRLLAVPILRNEKIVAILGVGNKAEDYTKSDIQMVSTLADFAWDAILHKHSESAVQASELKFRTLADWTYDWEKWLDPQGHVVYTSPSCERITGYSPQEIQADPSLLVRIVHPDDQAAYTEHLNLVHDEAVGPVTFEHRIINRDGTEYFVEHVCRPLFGADQAYLGRRISIRDVTIRKEKEKQIQLAHQELQKIYNTEHEQRQLTEALVEVDVASSQNLELEQVFSTILDKIGNSIPYSFANIYLLEGETFYEANQKGFSTVPTVQPSTRSHYALANSPALEKMRLSRRPILVANTSAEPAWESIETWEQVCSILAAPLLINKQVVGFLNLFSEIPDFYSEKMQYQLVAFAAHAATAIQNAWLFEQIRSGNERLQALSRRLVEAQENERQFIARELHDESGQALTSLMVDLRLLEKNASNPAEIIRRVAEMEQALDTVMKNLHRVAMALRPASLDHMGLVAALRQHAENISAKHGLKIIFKNLDIHERLPENFESTLYRIVQEALTNVVKHAHATQVDIILMKRAEQLVLIIEDNGIGFDPQAIPDNGHLGVFGMRERAQMIDGNLVIESTPGKGTTIIVEVKHANSFIAR